MNLSKTSDELVLSNLEKYVKSERKIIHVILWHILEVEDRKLYLQVGFDSTYKLLTEHLGYNESAAYDRLQAARVLRKVPSVAAKLEEGVLNLTQLVKVEQSIKQELKLGNTVTADAAKDLLEKIENKTTYETEKIIAVELSQTPKTYQKIKPQSNNTTRVEITFTDEQLEIIKKAQSLTSHAVTENDLAEAFVYFAKTTIQVKEGKTPKESSDLNAKASKQSKDKPGTESTPSNNANKSTSTNKFDGSRDRVSTQSFSLMPETGSEARQKSVRKPQQRSFRRITKAKRKYISKSIKRTLLSKASYCCEHINPKTQLKCGSKYQLQIDHIRPLAKGGTDDIANLRVLCGVHNRAEALRWGLWRAM